MCLTCAASYCGLLFCCTFIAVFYCEIYYIHRLVLSLVVSWSQESCNLCGTIVVDSTLSNNCELVYLIQCYSRSLRDIYNIYIYM